MEKKKEDKTRATRRVSSDEINKKVNKTKKKGKRTKASSETQVIGKVNATKTTKKNTKGKKKKFKERHPRIATIIRIFIIMIILLIIIIAGIFAGAIWGGYNFLDLLGDEYKIDLADLVIKENSIVYDAEGNQIAVLSAGEKRKVVKLKEMSEYLPKAYIAIEDERFYEHIGVDIKRTAAATLTYIVNGGSSSFGGSTITQQVVKNITQDKEDTATRKVKEMVKAIQVEHYLSKDEILELYLNLIFVGGNDVNGVALGAIYYFNKDVKDLSLAECAYMAAINNTPNSYNPFLKNEEDAEKKQQDRIKKGSDRTKVVLNQMKKLGYINNEEYNAAIKEVEAGLAFVNGDTNITVEMSYQTEAAIDQILDQMVEEMGISRDMAEIKLYSSGYSIYTTQITSVQNALEDEITKDVYSISSPSETQTSLATMTIIDPKTGNVVACGAGTKAENKKTHLGYFNYPTELKKQTGSSIKPIAVLAPGLESKTITAASVFYDGYTVFPGGYDPEEYYGGWKGNMTMRDAIKISANLPHVKAMSAIGIETCVNFCHSVGLAEVNTNDGLPTALGGLGTGVSTLQMAAAYAAIANDGVYIEPVFYKEVKDENGETILAPKTVEERSTRVLSEQNAYIVQSVLTAPVYESGGTATYCKIPGIQTAAKTGTTNDEFDRWLCGFTDYYAAACWFGYEKNEPVVFSGNPAGKIWAAVMKNIHTELPNTNFNKPDGVTSASICKDSGMKATDKCTNVYTEQFVTGTVPAACDKHEAVKICNETGKIANEYCEDVSEQYFVQKAEAESKYSKNWTTSYGDEYNKKPTEVCTHTPHDFTYED